MTALAQPQSKAHRFDNPVYESFGVGELSWEYSDEL